MPSNHLILCHPLLVLLSIFPGIRVFSNESVLHIRWPKFWSFNISPCNEYSGLISLGLTGLILLSKGLSRVFFKPQFKTSILWHSVFFMVQLSHPYVTTGKTIALTRQTFVSKVMSLLFNVLSRFVIGFLSRSKHLLISWLRLTFDLLSWVKKIHLHHSGWASSSPLRPWIEQKGKGSVNLLSSWAGTSIFSCFWTSALLYWGLWYWTDLYYWLSWFYILQIVVLLKLHNCVSQFL